MGHDFMEQIWFKTMFIVFAGFSSRQDVSFLKNTQNFSYIKK